MTDWKKEIVESVARGLRRIQKKPPDAFLFSSDGDWIWDEDTILGIPVFYTDVDFQWCIERQDACPFIPIWKTETTGYLSLEFAKGYE